MPLEKDTHERPPADSLEASLTALHTGRIATAQETIRDSEYNLGRIGLIYGGQLYFDFDGPAL